MKNEHELAMEGMRCCINSLGYFKPCERCPYEKHAGGCKAMLKGLADYIRELEAKVPKWISVDEELPEDGINVLMHTDSCDGDVRCGYYSLVRDAWYTSQGFLLASNVLHWMPMPEALKEDDHATD